MVQNHFGKPFLELVREWYVEKHLSTYEMSELVEDEVQVYLSPRAFQRALSRVHIPRRNQKESLCLARKKKRWKKS